MDSMCGDAGRAPVGIHCRKCLQSLGQRGTSRGKRILRKWAVPGEIKDEGQVSSSSWQDSKLPGPQGP